MSASARGCYISMLAFAWANGPIPDSARCLSTAMGWHTDDGPLEAIWDEIKPKWSLGGSGWTNARLEAVRAEQDAYRKRQSEAGRRGGMASKPQASLKQPLEACSSSSPSSSPSLEDQEQVQEQAHRARRCAKPVENSKLMLKLAHEVISSSVLEPERKDALKQRCAQSGVAYDADSIRKALDSVESRRAK